MKKDKLYNLQVLRGFAALIVCIHHSRFLITAPNKNEILDSLRGYIGVPLFFIISGFIMFRTTRHLTNNTSENVKQFLVKRFIRIVPLFYFSILMFILINHHGLINFFTTEAKTLLKTALFIPVFSDKTGPAYGFSFMYVSWTLNYEIFFYSIFAISLLFNKLRYLFIFSVFFLLVLMVPLLFKGFISFSPAIYYGFSLEYLNLMTNPILLFFVCGILIGFILDIVPLRPRFSALPAVISILIFTFYLFRIIPDFPESDLLICGQLVFFILYRDLSDTAAVVPEFSSYLGDISYSIYLLHPMVFMYLPNLLIRFGLGSFISSWYFLIFGLAVVIGASSLTHTFIEKRFSGLLKRALL